MSNPRTNQPSAPPAAPNSDASPDSDAPWLALVAEKVKSLDYGVVQIVVHDSRIVQIERTERFRFTPPQKH